jgi:hypothetical protein
MKYRMISGAAHLLLVAGMATAGDARAAGEMTPNQPPTEVVTVSGVAQIIGPGECPRCGEDRGSQFFASRVKSQAIFPAPFNPHCSKIRSSRLTMLPRWRSSRPVASLFSTRMSAMRRSSG